MAKLVNALHSKCSDESLKGSSPFLPSFEITLRAWDEIADELSADAHPGDHLVVEGILYIDQDNEFEESFFQEQDSPFLHMKDINPRNESELHFESESDIEAELTVLEFIRIHRENSDLGWPWDSDLTT